MRQSWDYIEEIMQILKTAFPLLIMNMETIVDQISARFKASPEEDIYRLVCMLLQEGLQVCFLWALLVLYPHLRFSSNTSLGPHNLRMMDP